MGAEDSEIVVRLYNHGIGRTENPFRAICFHLWHPEAERSRMDRNDQILEKALAEKHTVCENGIRPGPGNSETARKTPVPE